MMLSSDNCCQWFRYFISSSLFDDSETKISQSLRLTFFLSAQDDSKRHTSITHSPVQCVWGGRGNRGGEGKKGYPCRPKEEGVPPVLAGGSVPPVLAWGGRVHPLLLRGGGSSLNRTREYPLPLDRTWDRTLGRNGDRTRKDPSLRKLVRIR